MTVETLRRLWKNDYVQTAIMIILIVAIVFGFWYGLQLALNTQHPALAVATGSMCLLPGSYCDGWSHPFEPTLHVGDLIIVQNVSPTEIKTGPYPKGDIIVFHRIGSSDELIVHRAVDNATVDGKVYFRTEGDGNGIPDSWYGQGTWNGMISQDYVIGKVILRIPWIGHVSLFMRNSAGIILVAILIVLIVVVEFAVPTLTSKKTETEPKENVEKTSET